MNFNIANTLNPEVFAENRLEAHSNHTCYRNETEAKAGESSFIRSLNGIWKFKFSKNYRETVKGFESEGFDCDNWDDIRVPGHWQLQGFEAPQYVNIMYPWEGHELRKPGEVPQEYNPVGSYVTYFTIPEAMADERICISFQGVDNAFALWINGIYIGYSEDTFTPADFDITDAVMNGSNKLAVQVFKWTTASWLEDQDFWRLSGIFRDVYLYSKPAVHVEDMFVKAIPAEDFNTGSLDIRMKLSGSAEAASINVKLTDAEGGIVMLHTQNNGCGGELSVKASEISTAPNWESGLYNPEKSGIISPDVINTEIKAEVDKPALWSAELPYRYMLTITVSSSEGAILEVIRQQIGFRRFELKNGLMLINGKRIVFCGVNRHEFSADYGRAVTKAEIRKDLLNIKKNNMNAIRTSHYPNNPYFYDVCDEIGLYIIDETNLETHGTWGYEVNGVKNADALPDSKEQWHDVVIDRANSMLQRDKNHPCVIIWSCGNESCGGRNIFDMSEHFRHNDGTRLVHYEGVIHDRSYNATSDMESQMYTKVHDIKKFLAGNTEKPFISCEYTHAMGNSNGAMHKYTDLTDTEPRYQGGFIWDYIDQAIHTKNCFGEDYLAYGGDFGDRPHDGNFSGNGIAFADHSDTPKLQEVKFNYQRIEARVHRDNVEIINKMLFTNTAAFDCVVTCECEGELIDEYTLETKVAPLSSAVLALKTPDTERECVVTVSFRLKEDTAYAPKGYEAAFGQCVLEGCLTAPEKVSEEQLNAFRIINSNNNIGVKGIDFSAIFSKSATNGLVSYVYKGTEMMRNIVRPNFWRALTDNDMGNKQYYRMTEWKCATMYFILNGVSLEEGTNSAKITYVYGLATTPRAEVTVVYTVYADGRVGAELDYKKVEGLPELPIFGFRFTMNPEFENVTWYGNGPLETYADKKHGAKLGLYHNKVKDNMVPYLMPQECGNKTDVRYASVTDNSGKGLRFECENTMDFSALPYTAMQLDEASHAYELPRAFQTVVCASLMQMGVGGDDSWSALVHEEYRMPNKDYHFTMSFKGID